VASYLKVFLKQKSRAVKYPFDPSAAMFQRNTFLSNK